MPTLEEPAQQICEAIDRHSDEIIGIGEAIMDAPELGFKEHKTALRVQESFAERKLPFETELAITGVKAVLEGAKPGPTIALMGELDALQVP